MQYSNLILSFIFSKYQFFSLFLTYNPIGASCGHDFLLTPTYKIAQNYIQSCPQCDFSWASKSIYWNIEIPHTLFIQGSHHGNMEKVMIESPQTPKLRQVCGSLKINFFKFKFGQKIKNRKFYRESVLKSSDCFARGYFLIVSPNPPRKYIPTFTSDIIYQTLKF